MVGIPLPRAACLKQSFVFAINRETSQALTKISDANVEICQIRPVGGLRALASEA
jgi:hypothetical protein